jgi:aryl carrier-like protein
MSTPLSPGVQKRYADLAANPSFNHWVDTLNGLTGAERAQLARTWAMVAIQPKPDHKIPITLAVLGSLILNTEMAHWRPALERLTAGDRASLGKVLGKACASEEEKKDTAQPSFAALAANPTEEAWCARVAHMSESERIAMAKVFLAGGGDRKRPGTHVFSPYATAGFNKLTVSPSPIDDWKSLIHDGLAVPALKRMAVMMVEHEAAPPPEPVQSIFTLLAANPTEQNWIKHIDQLSEEARIAMANVFLADRGHGFSRYAVDMFRKLAVSPSPIGDWHEHLHILAADTLKCMAELMVKHEKRLPPSAEPKSTFSLLVENPTTQAWRKHIAQMSEGDRITMAKALLDDTQCAQLLEGYTFSDVARHYFTGLSVIPSSVDEWVAVIDTVGTTTLAKMAQFMAEKEKQSAMFPPLLESVPSSFALLAANPADENWIKHVGQMSETARIAMAKVFLNVRGDVFSHFAVSGFRHLAVSPSPIADWEGLIFQLLPATLKKMAELMVEDEEVPPLVESAPTPEPKSTPGPFATLATNPTEGAWSARVAQMSEGDRIAMAKMFLDDAQCAQQLDGYTFSAAAKHDFTRLSVAPSSVDEWSAVINELEPYTLVKMTQLMAKKEKQGAPVPPVLDPIHLNIMVQGRPGLHFMHPTLSLGAVQEKIKSVYGIDVTKPPAYLVYRFTSSVDDDKRKLWMMVHSQEELEYVVKRAENNKTTLWLQAVDDFAVFQKK